MVRLGRHAQLIDPDVGGVGLACQRNNADQAVRNRGLYRIEASAVIDRLRSGCAVGLCIGIRSSIVRILEGDRDLGHQICRGCLKSVRNHYDVAFRSCIDHRTRRVYALELAFDNGNGDCTQRLFLRRASAGHRDGIFRSGLAVLCGDSEAPDAVFACGRPCGDAGLFVGQDDLEAACRDLGVRLQLDRVGCLTSLRGRGMCDGDRAHACVSGLRRGSRNGDGVGLGGRAVLSCDSECPDIAFVRQSADSRLAVGALDVEAVRRDLRAGRNGNGVGAAFARNGNGACDRDGRDVRVVRLGLVTAAVFHGDGVGPLAVRLKFALVCDVHGGPARVRADDVDDAAVLNGDQRRARIFAAVGLRAEIGVDLIVLVCRRRRDAQQSRALRHSQGVGGDIAAERGRQLACAELERLEAGIRAVPAAAEILGSAGVHDADLIARVERAVRDRKVAEAEVGEPVVECAHPAGRWAAVKRLQVVNGGDVALTLFDLVLIAQRGEDAVHHGRIGLQLEPGVDQRAVPGSALRRRERGVLHDHMGHAGQRQNADIRHVRAVFVIGVLHIGERQRIAAGFELPVDAVRLAAADAVDERFRAAVLRKRDGQLIAIRLRGNAVAELQNGGGAQRKGKRGRGAGPVLFLIAALKTLQLAVVDPGIAAGVRSADGGDGLLGIGDMTDAVVVPLLVGFAADAAGIGLIAGEDLLGAGHRRMARGGDGIGLRFHAAVSAARADDLAGFCAGGRRPLAVFAAFRILAEVVAERRDIGRAVAFAALVAGVAGVALLGAQRGRDRALAIRFVEGHVLLPHERRIAAAADRGERVGQISVLQIVVAQRLGIRILPQRAQIIALGDLRGSGVDRAERRAARFAGGVAAGEGDFPPAQCRPSPHCP